MALMDAYAGPWTLEEAAHLARRAGFGARPDELASMMAAGMSSAVDTLVDYAPTDAPLEALIAALPATADNDALKNPLGSSQLEGWWLYRMVKASQPMQQQFALFFHDHFVSEYTKVAGGVTNTSNYGNDGSQAGQSCNRGVLGLPPDPDRQRTIIARLLKDQNALFCTIGHGPYREMLRAITRDPAMLIYLDNRVNVKGKAQENYGREIMELFTMGVGNYSEEDVREVARAFTGESIDSACATNWPYVYQYKSASHDTNPKIVFGNTFNFAGAGLDTDHVIDLLLARISGANITPAHATLPATSIYMAWKFLTWFVSDTIAISHAAVVELATYFYNNQPNGYRYDVRETLRKLLKSQFFFDASNRYNMYKRPADFIAMALRTLQLEETSYTGTAASNLRSMGMQLFSPPNVAGWNHGRMWINSTNLVTRFNYANRLSGTAIMTDAKCDALIPSVVANTDDDAALLEYYRARLLQTPLTSAEQSAFNTFYAGIKGSSVTSSQAQFRRKVRGTLHIMMTMPRYQLK